jgi:hypothetical protein
MHSQNHDWQIASGFTHRQEKGGWQITSCLSQWINFWREVYQNVRKDKVYCKYSKLNLLSITLP